MLLVAQHKYPYLMFNLLPAFYEFVNSQSQICHHFYFVSVDVFETNFQVLTATIPSLRISPCYHEMQV